MIPREQGIEGWLWTSLSGSALTVLGDPEDAPNAALLFTKPLGDDAVECFVPEVAEEIAARSPLGAPAVYGLLFRVTDTSKAETVFRQFGLLRPLTDREVPPTLRRALPTDRPADPALRPAARTSAPPRRSLLPALAKPGSTDSRGASPPWPAPTTTRHPR